MMHPIKPLCAAALSLTFAAFTTAVSAEEQAPAAPAESAGEVEVVADADAPQPAGEAMPEGMALPPAASKEDISFSIGYTIGTDMTQRGADLDAEHLINGIRAGLGLEAARLTDEQIAQCLFSFQMQMQQQYMQDMQANLDKGRAYLAENAKQEGVTVTESGLQYRVLHEGDGATPTVNDVVSARYKGTLIDGTVFDQSEGDETVSFPVGRVIPGWVEALQLMQVGDKWELTIPSELAYGEQGAPGGAIGPNEVLRFEIELVGIE
ncbi:MAG: FKBP-type peptidyl-prolyl cis-trans isomerase [Phycisphaerales bacterium]